MIDSLLPLVAKAPSQPIELTQQQLHEIRARLKQGEPMPRIAAAYRVDVDVIQAIDRSRQA